MPTIPTGKVERELRALYLRWIKGLTPEDPDIADKVQRFAATSQALIERLGGRTAMLGALGDFPVPKLLDLSPTAGVVYSAMQQAAIAAGISIGNGSRETARAMFRAGMDKNYRRLERLARTETTNAYWKNAFSSVADLPAIVMVWGAEESKRTCQWCLERDGMVIEDGDLRDHPNGRCTPIPTLRSRVEYKGSVRRDGSIYMDPAWGTRREQPKPAPFQTIPQVDMTPTPQATPTIQPRRDDPNGVAYADMTGAQKIRAAEVMYGTGSPQHQAAKKKWRGK